MAHTPPLRAFNIYFLHAPVQQISIEDGHTIGVWESHFSPEYEDDLKGRLTHAAWPPQPRKPGEVVTDFVNAYWGDDAVRWFTNKYGPLDEEPRAGGSFRFPIKDWRDFQKELQSDWRFIADRQVRESAGALVFNYRELNPRDVWKFGVVGEGRGLFYRAALLRDYLRLDLYSLLQQRVERIRFCAWPDCMHTPYFIAYGDLRQKYCSPECANEAAKKSNRESIARARQEASAATAKTSSRRKRMRSRKTIRTRSSARKHTSRRK